MKKTIPTYALAAWVAGGVALLGALNAIFTVFLQWCGISHPWCFFPGDLFADYFKTIFSYPGGSDVSIWKYSWISSYLEDYRANNPYNGVGGLASGHLTHFHLPPLTTLFCLLSLKTFQYVPCELLYLMTIALCIALYVVILRFLFWEKPFVAVLFACAMLMAYPYMFAIQRGNLISLLSSLGVMWFLATISMNRLTISGIVSLAAVSNFRPNLALFILAVFVLRDGSNRQRMMIFFAATSLFFLGSLAMVKGIYSDYSLENFILGLRIYRGLYVMGDSVLYYNSSLSMLMAFFFGVHPGLQSLVSVMSIFIGTAAVLWIMKNKGKLSTVTMVLCVITMVSTDVFADYHLLIFFAPMLVAVREFDSLKLSDIQNRFLPIRDDLAVLLVSCVIIMAPKNYLYLESGFSLFQIINPTIGIAACCYLVREFIQRRQLDQICNISSS